MRVVWTSKASSDLVRLHDFLAAANPRAAREVAGRLAAAPKPLASTPRLGERLTQFDPREVRRLFVGAYELRYEISDDRVHVLRLWHALEHR